MSQVQVRLKPAWHQSHTGVTITMALPRRLDAWELLDLCEMLRVRSASRVRVVLPADASSEWLDGWSEVLAEAVAGRIEVQFVAGRR